MAVHQRERVVREARPDAGDEAAGHDHQQHEGRIRERQAALGIATVVNVVPLALAALHQAGAVLLFGLAIVLAHALREGAAIAPTAPNGEDPRSPLVPPDYDHGRDPRT